MQLPHIGDRERHLIGKLLDSLDDDELADMGFSPDERELADWLHGDLSKYLSERMGVAWMDLPVEIN
jgi:hypothetical protein